MICLGYSDFKQTFVLDPTGGVDIMPPLRESGASSIASSASAEEIMDETPNLQLEKYR